MSEPPPAPTPQDMALTAESRERSRRARWNLLWAYLSVAFVLVVLIALAWVSLGVGWRAEQAEREAKKELEKSYLAQARGRRLATTLTRRDETLEIVRSAAALRPTAELRNEAVAALALPDFQAESTIPLSPDLRWSAISPDLGTAAEGLANGDIVLRRLSDGGEIARLTLAAAGIPAGQSGVVLIAFSNDGSTLAARYSGGALAVWDPAGQKPLFVHDADKVRHPLALPGFSSDGKWMVGPIFTPVEGQGAIEVATGRILTTFPDLASWRHTAVRPGTTEFAVNSERGVAVIDWSSRQQLAAFDFPAGCRSLTWTADGKHLGIAGNQSDVHVWNYPDRRLQVFGGHHGDVHTLLFDSRGELAASSSVDGQTRLWDMRTGHLLGVENGRALRLGPGGRLGIEKPVDQIVAVRRLGPSPVYRRWRGEPVVGQDMRAMDVSPDGTTAATGVSGQGLRLWNLQNPDAGPVPLALPELMGLCFNPADGSLLLGKKDGPVNLDWRAALIPGSSLASLFQPLRPMEGRNRALLVTSPDGRRLAAVNVESGSVSAAAIAEKDELFSLRGRHNSVARISSSVRGTGTLSFSPDNRWLACGYAGSDGALVLDASTGRSVQRLSRAEGAVQFSPDGRWLVVARIGRLQLFRSDDWTLAWEKTLPRYAAAAAAFSPDGRRLAAPDSAITVGLWETASGRPLCSLEAPDAVPPTVLRWSADGRRLLCGLRDQNIEAWDLAPLESQLSHLGLGLDLPLDSQPSTARPDFPFKHLAAGVSLIGGGAAAIALLALRRYRRLITETLESDAVARQRERDLEAARELTHLKDTFVSMVSHEFRTPLAVILSSAELLNNHLDRLSPERRARQFESIRGSTLRMARLVDDVLLLGKVEGGHLSFAPARVALRDFCDTLVDEALSASHRRCPIDLGYADDLPDAIQADPALLRHVLSNLLSNAAKYSPEGSPIAFDVRTAAGGGIVFRVTDHGIGIPEADLPHLFEAFHRAGNVGSIAGTGLGLVIAKRCAGIHGGTLSATSQIGRGTTFTVTIPNVPPPATP